MRGCGFFIIKPTKAENCSINNLRSDLGLLWTHASTLYNKKMAKAMRNGRTGRLGSPRDLGPRPKLARPSRACCIRETRGLSPRGEVARARFGRGLSPRLRVARATSFSHVMCFVQPIFSRLNGILHPIFLEALGMVLNRQLLTYFDLLRILKRIWESKMKLLNHTYLHENK